jgi:hypothetical protein
VDVTSPPGAEGWDGGAKENGLDGAAFNAALGAPALCIQEGVESGEGADEAKAFAKGDPIAEGAGEAGSAAAGAAGPEFAINGDGSAPAGAGGKVAAGGGSGPCGAGAGAKEKGLAGFGVGSSGWDMLLEGDAVDST